MNETLKIVTCSSVAAPGEAFNILWYVLWIAFAALSMNVSMSASSTELAMSVSEVRIIVWWMRVRWQLLWGFLIFAGLRFYDIALHMFKIHLNFDPVSYKNIGTRVSTQPGFCQLINCLLLDDLLKISLLLTLLLSLIMLVNWLAVIQSSSKLLSVPGLTRSTHRAS